MFNEHSVKLSKYLFVFSRFNVNSKNLLIVQKDFWAEKWNQKNVISWWKASDPEQKIMKIKI